MKTATDFRYHVRTARDNGMSADCLPETLRIVYLGYKQSPIGGFDVAYVSPDADDDNGNESAALIADALNEFLSAHPERLPKQWDAMVCGRYS
jgi:hypothetical protein